VIFLLLELFLHFGGGFALVEDFMNPKKMALETMSSPLAGVDGAFFCAGSLPCPLPSDDRSLELWQDRSRTGPEAALDADRFLGESPSDEAAANVILAGPEKSQAHASGHDVVELDRVGGGASRTHPVLPRLGAAVRRRRACGWGKEEEKKN